jgi:hypothetical protein
MPTVWVQGGVCASAATSAAKQNKKRIEDLSINTDCANPQFFHAPS